MADWLHGDRVRRSASRGGHPERSRPAGTEVDPRSTLQRTFRELASDGLIVVRQGRTAVVAGGRWGRPARLAPLAPDSRARLRASRLPAACLPPDEAGDDPADPQHPGRRAPGRGMLELGRWKSCRVCEAADRYAGEARSGVHRGRRHCGSTMRTQFPRSTCGWPPTWLTSPAPQPPRRGPEASQDAMCGLPLSSFILNR